MNSMSNRQIPLDLSFITPRSGDMDEVTYLKRYYKGGADDSSQDLKNPRPRIDIINPQPKSSTFYSKVKTVKPQAGRVKRAR